MAPGTVALLKLKDMFRMIAWTRVLRPCFFGVIVLRTLLNCLKCIIYEDCYKTYRTEME